MEACRSAMYYHAMVVTAFVVAALFCGWRFATCRNMLHSMETIGAASLEKGASGRLGGLSGQERLLLFGKSGAGNAADRWEPLWQSDPDDPAFFQQYVEGVVQTSHGIPQELLVEAERIDPGNAYIPTLAAACLARDAQEKERLPWSREPTRTTPVWTVTDPERADEAYEMLRRASRMPAFDDHQRELLRERLSRLPQAEDVPGQYAVVAYMAGQTTIRIHFRYLTDLLAARAQQCGAQGDAEGFIETARLWHWLVTRSAPSGNTLIDQLLTRAMVSMPMLNFRDAARQLGMDELADRFDALDQRIEAEKSARKDRERTSVTVMHIELYASLFNSLSLPSVDRYVASPPVLTEADLRPSRRAEYAILDQFHALAAAALFGLCAAFAALSPLFHGSRNDALSKRMAALVSTRDVLAIAIIGILLPLALHFAISRFTPLATHGISMRRTGLIAPVGQLVCLTLGMIALTLALASRKLVKRGAGAPFRAGWIGWVAAACAFLAVLIFAVPFPDMRILKVAMMLGGATALWLLVLAVMHVFGKPRARAEARATLARVLVPVWMTAMLFSTLMLPVHVLEERHWVARDDLNRIGPSSVGVSRFESEVARQLGKENAELLETLPLPDAR